MKKKKHISKEALKIMIQEMQVKVADLFSSSPLKNYLIIGFGVLRYPLRPSAIASIPNEE